MKEILIQCVCGVGVGSSQFLKMQIDDIAQKQGITGLSVSIGDVLTAASANCDAIFTSKEISEVIGDKTNIPVIVIHNFVDKKEISEQLNAFLQQVRGNNLK